MKYLVGYQGDIRINGISNKKLNIENLRSHIIYIPQHPNLFNRTLFPEEIYFLSTMPYELDYKSILLISICSIISTCLVSLFPAIKASNLDTIKSLKYE